MQRKNSNSFWSCSFEGRKPNVVKSGITKRKLQQQKLRLLWRYVREMSKYCRVVLEFKPNNLMRFAAVAIDLRMKQVVLFHHVPLYTLRYNRMVFNLSCFYCSTLGAHYDFVQTFFNEKSPTFM